MLSLEDGRWSTLEGGYRTPFDPRPLFLKLRSPGDERAAWDELWEELHHQGDVGLASYAAVPHLVRVHQERGVPDWNTYALVATIELARDANRNPRLPKWLADGYDKALSQLAKIGSTELFESNNPELVRSVLGILAIVKGARVYGRVLSEFSEDEVLELEEQANGDAE